MAIRFRPGQLVRLLGIPADLPPATDELPTTTLFRACLGQSFPIAEIDRDMIALDVGEALGQSSWKQTIYVAPELLEPVTE